MRDISGRNRVRAEALRDRSIEVLELDVTDQGWVDKAVAQLLSQAGRIDVLVNNAGIASAGVGESFTTEQVQALFDVNVFGVMRATRAVLPTMRAQRRGLVINVGSILDRVAAQAGAGSRAGLSVVICIGETLAQRQGGARP